MFAPVTYSNFKKPIVIGIKTTSVSIAWENIKIIMILPFLSIAAAASTYFLRLLLPLFSASI